MEMELELTQSVALLLNCKVSSSSSRVQPASLRMHTRNLHEWRRCKTWSHHLNLQTLFIISFVLNAFTIWMLQFAYYLLRNWKKISRNGHGNWSGLLRSMRICIRKLNSIWQKHLTRSKLKFIKFKILRNEGEQCELCTWVLLKSHVMSAASKSIPSQVKNSHFTGNVLLDIVHRAIGMSVLFGASAHNKINGNELYCSFSAFVEHAFTCVHIHNESDPLTFLEIDSAASKLPFYLHF